MSSTAVEDDTSILELFQEQFNLDETLTCRWKTCPNKAEWRATMIHVDGKACMSILLCTQHKNRLSMDVAGILMKAAFMAFGGKNVDMRCVPHSMVVSNRPIRYERLS